MLEIYNTSSSLRRTVSQYFWNAITYSHRLELGYWNVTLLFYRPSRNASFLATFPPRLNSNI